MGKTGAGTQNRTEDAFAPTYKIGPLPLWNSGLLVVPVRFKLTTFSLKGSYTIVVLRNHLVVEPGYDPGKTCLSDRWVQPAPLFYQILIEMLYCYNIL